MFSGKKYRGNCVDILPSYVYNKFNKIDLQKYFAKVISNKEGILQKLIR